MAGADESAHAEGDMNGQVWALVGVIVSTAGAYLVARLSMRAQQRKTEVDEEMGAGELALKIANRADEKATNAERKADRLDQWRIDVTEGWWPSHRRRDEAVEAELERLDPGAIARLPSVVPFPSWKYGDR